MGWEEELFALNIELGEWLEDLAEGLIRLGQKKKKGTTNKNHKNNPQKKKGKKVTNQRSYGVPCLG